VAHANRRLVALYAASFLAVACSSGPLSTPTDGPSAPPTPSPSAAPTSAPSPSPSPSPSVSPTPTPSPSPTRPPTLPATPSPSASPPPGSVVVTFAVVDEVYRILLTDPDDIEIARRLLAGDEAPSIPNGEIVRGAAGVNTDWSWHIDPSSVEFADVTIEVCDGLPSHVEDGTLAGDRYCPWSAEVIEIEPAG